MDRNLISFVIPAYNAEKYIQRCIDSILQLNFKQGVYEVVVIDDGSSDGTREKVTCYNENIVKYYYKENGGVSSARNYGIKKSSGQYMMFVDADDEVMVSEIKTIISYLQAEKSDVIMFEYESCLENGTYLMKSHSDLQTPINSQVLAKRFISYPICGYFEESEQYLGAKVFQYIIKRHILIENSICFPENIHFGEDLCFLYSVMQNIQNVDYFSVVGYRYYIIPGSASHSYRVKYARELFDIYEYVVANNKAELDPIYVKLCFSSTALRYYAQHLPYYKYRIEARKIFLEMREEKEHMISVCKDKGIFARMFASAYVKKSCLSIYILINLLRIKYKMLRLVKG